MKSVIVLNEQQVEYQLIYRKRTTMEIQIKPVGEIRVLVPQGMSRELVAEQLRNKSAWILTKLANSTDDKYAPRQLTYGDGETHYYLGESYSLEIKENHQLNEPHIQLTSQKFLVETPTTEHQILANAFCRWYQEKALQLFAKRVEDYQSAVGKQPTQVRLSRARKRWGSCSSKGVIRFNWRVVMAPVDVVDYLVIHEMCHLVHMNHSPAFWTLVKSILPNYETSRQWLRTYGATLDVYN